MADTPRSRLRFWWFHVVRWRVRLIPVVAAMINRGVWVTLNGGRPGGYVTPHWLSASFFVGAATLAALIMWPRRAAPAARAAVAVAVTAPYILYAMTSMDYFGWSWHVFGGPFFDFLLTVWLVAGVSSPDYFHLEADESDRADRETAR